MIELNLLAILLFSNRKHHFGLCEIITTFQFFQRCNYFSKIKLTIVSGTIKKMRIISKNKKKEVDKQ